MVKASEFAARNENIIAFNRHTYSDTDRFTYIGDGHLGGKARRLAEIDEKIVSQFKDEQKNNPISVNIPRLTVITTEYFDLFMERNRLYRFDFCKLSDERIARIFKKAKLPEELLLDLEVLIENVKTPIAVRSSTLMEDSLDFPFAGIYQTKMLPNNQPDPAVRLRYLVEAIKFVYASTFFAAAKCSMRATSRNLESEKMAVIIQEVVGRRHHDRFYPNISGVARSYNFYPSGHAGPEHGVVNLALGLGKAIVDGGAVWTYSPEYPEVNPPYASVNEMLEQTQLDFWAINMGKISSHEHPDETEFLVRLTLKDAEKDNTLGYIASTYDYESDRINIGIGFGGSRIINFAPLLQVDLIPLNQLIKSLLKVCEETFKKKVEIEFAVNFDFTRGLTARFSLLQIRPMAVSEGVVELGEDRFSRAAVLAASDNVMGNGCVDMIRDIVYVVPETFDLKNTVRIVGELERVNRLLVGERAPYLLVGFGRWGTSNPYWGIPVNWGQICGARVIVESELPGLRFQLTQGSHFFHNMTNLKIFYFSMKEDAEFPIDWEWLETQTEVTRKKYVRHVRLNSPLAIKVDGRRRKGVIFKPHAAPFH